MLTLPFSLVVAIYVGSACVVAFGLWFYYDRRDRRLYDLERRKVNFHCIRCDKLYTAKSGTELCECPRCHFQNQRLTF